MKTYEPSGQFAPTVFLMWVLATALLVGLGWVYQKGVDWIPFIYLNFLLTLGLGFAGFFGVSMAITLGKCRSKAVGVGLGVVGGVVAVAATHYFAWQNVAADAAAEMDIAASQVTWGMYLEARLATGWTLGSEGGLELSGAFVWIFWGIEAVIIAGGAALGAFTAWANPFCERCGKWTDDEPELGFAVDEPSPSFHTAVETADSINDLMALPANTGDQRFDGSIVFAVSRCPECQETAFLSVSHDVQTWDEESGDVKTDSTEIFANIVMGRDHLGRLEALGERLSAPEETEDSDEALAEAE